MLIKNSEKRIIKNTIVVILIFSIQACSTTTSTGVVGPYPDNYKQIIKDFAVEIFYDPYSLRSVSITKPRKEQSGWIVCLRLNAKNRVGGYTGVESNTILIDNNEVIGWEKGLSLCEGRNLDYKPWPELENL